MTIPVLCGPTAAGKTAAACAVFGGSGALAVSVDSMQVYREMDIGTAKPDARERATLEHVMIDCVDPAEVWSVGEHLRQAREHIAAALEEKRPVVIVGGTGLYVRGLVEGLCEGPARDAGLRRQFESREQEAPGSLYAELAARDPETADRLSPGDLRRIIRALEVLYLTGTGITRLHREQTRPGPWKYALVGLILDRDELAARIEARVERMFADGLFAEVSRLVERGCHAGMTSMQGVGYRECLACIEGRISLDQARHECVVNTRALAHRQIMLFRRMPSLVWFHARDYERIAAHCAKEVQE